jgi:hypothetical protein
MSNGAHCTGASPTTACALDKTLRQLVRDLDTALAALPVPERYLACAEFQPVEEMHQPHGKATALRLLADGLLPAPGEPGFSMTVQQLVAPARKACWNYYFEPARF